MQPSNQQIERNDTVETPIWKLFFNLSGVHSVPKKLTIFQFKSVATKTKRSERVTWERMSKSVKEALRLLSIFREMKMKRELNDERFPLVIKIYASRCVIEDCLLHRTRVDEETVRINSYNPDHLLRWIYRLNHNNHLLEHFSRNNQEIQLFFFRPYCMFLWIRIAIKISWWPNNGLKRQTYFNGA